MSRLVARPTPADLARPFVRCRAVAAAWTLVLIATAFVAPLAAQSPFTIDDVFSLRSVSVADVADDGGRLVVSMGTVRDRIGIDNYRYGDPTYVAPRVAELLLIDARTGASKPIFPEKRQVAGVEFSPDGSRIAMLVRDGDAFHLAIYDVGSARIRTVRPPAGRVFDDGSPLDWTPDGSKLLVALHSTDWVRRARERFEHEVSGPIVVRSSEEPFLSWDEIRRLSAVRIPAVYDLARNRFDEALPETMLAGFALTADGAALRYETDRSERTSYETGGRDASLKLRPLGGEEKILLESTRGYRFLWAEDGRRYVYGREGAIFAGTIDDTLPGRRFIGPEPARRGDAARADTSAARRDSATTPADSAARAAERERQRRARFTPVRLSPDGGTLIAQNSEGYWFVDVATGERERFLDAPSGGAGDDEDEEEEEDETRPRWSIIAWTDDANLVYLQEESRTAWDRAIHIHDRRTGQRRELVRGAAQHSGITLSADGSTVIFTRTEPNRPGDVFVANADFSNSRRLTDANPQLRDRALGEARLIDYLDADGETLHGVLYLPPGHQDGIRVPTIFLVYEDYFDPRFNSTIALLNANGYAVIQPSVRLERGYPGEAWLKGVTAAANKLIEIGIADPDRLGVHGTSYGGYATNLLITQTNRFKAAINISGKVDMISFYTDSPRLGIRNVSAPERGQDRIGATLWEQPQKYVAHSAIMFADRIETPLLLMTGQQDHNVPERTTSEMFYALRRLGKRVEWVSYVNGGHGMPSSTVDEVVDYHARILGWYDQYLKAEAKAEADAEMEMEMEVAASALGPTGGRRAALGAGAA